MSKYTTTKRTLILSDNTRIEADGFSSIQLTNLGADECRVDDNIPLPAGASYTWENHPNVIISDAVFVRFEKAELDRKVLVQLYYFKSL